jgi:hypothetical protein
MTTYIFEFWQGVPGDAKVHPEDRAVFGRISSDADQGHGFNLNCLPSPFAGPLRTAPVVMLYLNPGLAPQDEQEADDPSAQERQFKQRQGDAALPGEEDYASAWKWWSERTKRFGELSQFRDRIAFLNIAPYHSTDFRDPAMLAALPSCRAAIDWAQTVLFPQAEAGNRLVLCMRSAQVWGLGRKRRYGKGLFAPAMTRGGHMLGEGDDVGSRDEVVAAVRGALGLSSVEVS